MATTVTKTIGTSSRDYSTLQAWADALPANLVTADQEWIGECYNDSEFLKTTSGTFLSITGHTTDATRDIILRCATGQSFRDNASVNTNPLKYDQSKGVGIQITADYSTLISILNDYVTLDGLQIKNTKGGTDCVLMSGVYAGRTVKNCIVDNSGNGGSKHGVYMYSSTSSTFNTVCIQRGTSNAFYLGDGGKARYCTAIKPSDGFAAGSGFAGAYNNSLALSCASFGFGTGFDSNYTDASCGYNGTDKASAPGSNNKTSITYNSTSPFVSGTGTTLDATPIGGTNLAANGFYDASYATDIKKYTRANPPTIGCWEIVSAAPANTSNFFQMFR